MTEPMRDDYEYEKGFIHENIFCKILKTTEGIWYGYVREPNGASITNREDGDTIISEINTNNDLSYGPDNEGWIGFEYDLSHMTPPDNQENSAKEQTKEIAEKINTEINHTI